MHDSEVRHAVWTTNDLRNLDSVDLTENSLNYVLLTFCLDVLTKKFSCLFHYINS